MHPIVLAHERRFNIGPVSILPSTRTVARAERTEILEPRVMQVLVALARADGEVVSRDDLVEACWNGRIVGDDAINRVIGRLRRTAEGLGEGVFTVETITRVGYRLRLHSNFSIDELSERVVLGPKQAAGISRRSVAISAGAASAVAIVGTGMLWNLRHSQPAIPASTAVLMEQARFAMSQDTREGQNQAIGLFRQVASDYPHYADAWAFLALTYASTSHYRQTSEAEVLRNRAVSAATRAQAIDARNPIARSGRALARAIVGNWSPIGAVLGQSANQKPQTYEVSFALGKFLAGVGRNSEALHFESLLTPSQPIPSYYYNRALLLWAVGRDEELDNDLAEAARIFPTHYAIWFARFYVPMLSGRPEQALALAADTTNRPTNIEQAEVDSVVRVAHAIQSRAQGEVESVTSEWMAKAHTGAGYAENAVQFMAAMGRIDDAFSVLRAYFFSEGFDCGEVRFSASQGTYTPRNDRLTAWLFNPALAPIRSDIRFGPIVNRLGLTRYWKDAGYIPDYLSARG